MDASPARFIAFCLVSLLFTFAACENPLNNGGPPPPTHLTVEDATEWLKVQTSGTSGNPVKLVIDVDLGNMPWAVPQGNWLALLNAIDEAGKHVYLDLSASTMSGSIVFNPGKSTGAASNHPGMGKIVGLVLPDIAESIANGTTTQTGSTTNAISVTFRNFNNLRSISGAGIKNTGLNTFSELTSLVTVSFPAVTVIGERAFFECTNLATIDLQTATSIGHNAFRQTKISTANFPAVVEVSMAAFINCFNLVTASFPQATHIRIGAFSNSTSLATLYLPLATHIDEQAFQHSGISVLSLPEATNIGHLAFHNNRNLVTVNLPKVTTIGNEAFRDCARLSEVYIPKVQTIGQSTQDQNVMGTFHNCPALTRLTLGETPPSFPANYSHNEWRTFRGTTTASFTIRRPSASATLYDTWLAGNQAHFNNDAANIQFRNYP